jgi:threonine aldolase
VALADYYKCADTISMCFSKGLGAPVGSIIVASGEVMSRARKKRKQLGGGMRQVGVLAAAAMYALDHHVDRLRDDHKHARRLAGAVEQVEGLRLTHAVETNILIFAVDGTTWTVPSFLAALAAQGVLAVPFGPDRVRMVTHLDVSSEDIDRVVEVIGNLRPS